MHLYSKYIYDFPICNMHKEGKIISHIPATPKPHCSSSSMRLEDLPEVQPSTNAGLHWYIYNIYTQKFDDRTGIIFSTYSVKYWTFTLL